jgi:NADP oxidoreductase coenzyme F420-dependent
LTAGGERVVLAVGDEADAAALAGTLGGLASAAPVKEAIQAADVVMFAVWFDVLTRLLTEHGALLDEKVVVDPSNPIGFTADGNPYRTLPDGQFQGSLVTAMLPAGAHYVKAFERVPADPEPVRVHRPVPLPPRRPGLPVQAIQRINDYRTQRGHGPQVGQVPAHQLVQGSEGMGSPGKGQRVPRTARCGSRRRSAAGSGSPSSGMCPGRPPG